jgi:hypothetical protein
LIWIFIGFSCSELHCQIEQYNYVGVQTFESGDFVSYYLDFEFFESNIQGRAIVDYGGPDETLYYFKGFYNSQANLLQFSTSYRIWTKSDVLQKDYCILNFAGVVKNLKTVKSFSGPYTSNRKSRDHCAKGLLILSRIFKSVESGDKLEGELEVEIKIETSSQTESEEINNPQPSIPETLPEQNKATQPPLQSTPIKKDENLNVFVQHKKVTLLIYDAGKVDDDRVSISVNGELVLEDYSIEREKKELEIVLQEGKSVIEVTALNEGTKPPNTVKVEIIDESRKISIRTSLKKGEKASLTLLNQ